MSELESEGREDGPEAAPVVKIARTEEARAELPVREARLRKRLRDSRLPSSGQTVEPEHLLIPFVIQPGFKLGEDISPGPLHASLPVPAEISSVCGVIHPPEESKVHFSLVAGYYT